MTGQTKSAISYCDGKKLFSKIHFCDIWNSCAIIV